VASPPLTCLCPQYLQILKSRQKLRWLSLGVGQYLAAGGEETGDETADKEDWHRQPHERAISGAIRVR
jgi:hypothetical protein